MATNREQSELEIRLNAEQTKKELKEVEERLKLLNKEKKEIAKAGYAPDSAAALRYRELDKEIRAANKSRKELSNSFKESLTVIINGDVAGKSLNNLRAALRLAKADFNKLIDPADMARQAASINVIQRQIDKLEAPIKKTVGFWQGLSKEVKAFGVLAASYLGFQFISSKISNIIEKNAKLSDSFADVQRVAGLTKTEVTLLNEQLGKIDTRTGRAELLSIAVVAGKLGVAKGDIYDFTKSVDQLVVALGDELGNADEITTQLGKILNVFKGKVTADDLTKLGNAFVELANNGVATGGFIADFTQRVSGIAKASNLSLGATVGLAAGFEELGLRSESSATALQKLLSNIASDTPKAAKIAGIELSKFNELFGKTPEQALIAYARGLVKNKESFSEIAKQFKDAGEDGARVVQTLQAIGQSGEFLSEKINLGNASLKESNAIMDAFALKNETLGAKLDKLGKTLYGAFNNPVVVNLIERLTDLFLKLAPAQESAATSATRIVAANNAQINKAKELLKEYDLLAKTQEKTVNIQERMKYIAYELKQTIGSSAIAINNETKAVIVNREAVLSAISEKDKANVKEIANLANRANALNKSYEEDRARVVNGKKLVDQQIAQLNELGIKEKYAITAQINTILDKKRITGDYGEEGLKSILAYQSAIKNLELANTGLITKRKEMSEIQKQILAFGYSVDDVKRIGDLLTSTQKKVVKLPDATKATEPVVGGNDDNDKVKSAKEEYAARNKDLTDYFKSRLNTITTFSTQERNFDRAQKQTYATEEQISVGRQLQNTVDLAKAKLNTIEKGSEDEKALREKYRIALNALDAYWDNLDIDTEKIKQEELNRLTKDAEQYRLESELTAAKIKLDLVEEGSKEEVELKKQYLIKEYELYAKSVGEQSSLAIKAKKQLNKDLEDLDAEYTVKFIDNLAGALNTAASLYAEYDNYLTLKENNAVNKARKASEDRKRYLEDELEHGRISQDEYTKKIDQINEDARIREHKAGEKQFERNKKLQMAQIAINAASAIMQLYSKYDYYVATALGLALTALAAFEINEVYKQEYPEYKTGGILLEGPAHENGGIDVISNGKKIAELEGGEIIGSKRFVENNPELAQMILSSSRNGGAKINADIPRFNSRIAFDNVTAQSSSNTSSISKIDGGGRNINELLDTAQYNDVNTTNATIELLHKSNEILEKISSALIAAESKKVVFVQRDYEKFKTELEYAQNQTKV